MASQRDYQHERMIEDPKRKQERSNRNKARRVMEAKVGKAALKGREVDHKNGAVTGSPRLADLRAVSPRENNTGRGGGSKFKKKG